MRKPSEIKRDAEEINHLSTEVYEDLPRALKELREAQPGFPTTSGGASLGGGSLNDAGKPNGLDRYVIRIDPASAALADLDDQMLKAREAIRATVRIISLWSRVAKPGDDSEPPDQCVCCERFVVGGDDRLRAGLCQACHQSWLRWKKTNTGSRHDWLIPRQKSIVEMRERAEAL